MEKEACDAVAGEPSALPPGMGQHDAVIAELQREAFLLDRRIWSCLHQLEEHPKITFSHSLPGITVGTRSSSSYFP